MGRSRWSGALGGLMKQIDLLRLPGFIMMVVMAAIMFVVIIFSGSSRACHSRSSRPWVSASGLKPVRAAGWALGGST